MKTKHNKQNPPNLLFVLLLLLLLQVQASFVGEVFVFVTYVVSVSQPAALHPSSSSSAALRLFCCYLMLLLLDGLVCLK